MGIFFLHFQHKTRHIWTFPGPGKTYDSLFVLLVTKAWMLLFWPSETCMKFHIMWNKTLFSLVLLHRAFFFSFAQANVRKTVFHLDSKEQIFIASSKISWFKVMTCLLFSITFLFILVPIFKQEKNFLNIIY